MKFHTVEQLGEKRSFTREGFLVCHDVPIARTGTMLYHHSELDHFASVKPNKDGIVRVLRDEEAVFNPVHIASYNGKPVCNDHPPEMVTPDNWGEYAVGHVMNTRRGTAGQADMLLADFIITKPEAIAAILEDDKVQVSCGYDADYLPGEDGEARQLNLMGNHVALVTAGRCGPRCAISDHDHSTGELEMMTKDNATVGLKERMASFVDSVRKAVTSKDQAAIERALAEAPVLPASVSTSDEGVNVHIHAPANAANGSGLGLDSAAKDAAEETENRFKKIEDSMKAIADSIENLGKEKEKKETDDSEAEKAAEEEKAEEGSGTKDAIMAAKDSVPFADAFSAALSGAEILAPGMSLPAFDEAASPEKTIAAIKKLRTTALDLAYMGAETRGIIDDLLGGKPLALDSMKAKDVKQLFTGAVTARKAMVTTDVRHSMNRDASPGAPVERKGPIKTIGDINKAWADKYKQPNQHVA